MAFYDSGISVLVKFVAPPYLFMCPRRKNSPKLYHKPQQFMCPRNGHIKGKGGVATKLTRSVNEFEYRTKSFAELF